MTAINREHADALMCEADRLLGEMAYGKAVDLYDRLLALDPTDAAAWHHRGYALRRLGRYEEALVAFDRELELAPVNTEAIHSNRGYCLQGLGRYEEAIAAFDEVLQINPRHVKALTSRGLCLAALGRYRDALVCYDRALEPNMLNAFVWHAKSKALNGLDRRDEGIEAEQIALRFGYLVNGSGL
jgi:tetratricopeptide (TPR) repeat protein